MCIHIPKPLTLMMSAFICAFICSFTFSSTPFNHILPNVCLCSNETFAEVSKIPSSIDDDEEEATLLADLNRNKLLEVPPPLPVEVGVFELGVVEEEVGVFAVGVVDFEEAMEEAIEDDPDDDDEGECE
jgi:hypothetical protein